MRKCYENLAGTNALQGLAFEICDNLAFIFISKTTMGSYQFHRTKLDRQSIKGFLSVRRVQITRPTHNLRRVSSHL